MKNELEFPFKKVIGVSDEKKEEVEEKWHEHVEERDVYYAEKLKSHRLETSSENEEVIENVEKYVDEMVSSYGGNPIKFPHERIILLKKGSVSDVTRGKFKEAFCASDLRLIFLEYGVSKLDFALRFAHEMFHIKNFSSVRYDKQSDKISNYRSGVILESKDGFASYFAKLDEALTAESVRLLFENHIAKDPQFSDEISQTKFIKKWIEKLLKKAGHGNEKIKSMTDEIYFFPDAGIAFEVLSGNESDMYKMGFLQGYFEDLFSKGEGAVFRERMRERKMLDSLIGNIIKNSEGKYSSRKEILNIMLGASSTGNFLPMARMIEKNLKAGSFRQMAIDFAEFENSEDKEKFLLGEKKRNEKKDLKQRQRERTEKLEKMEDEGILYVKGQI